MAGSEQDKRWGGLATDEEEDEIAEDTQKPEQKKNVFGFIKENGKEKSC